MSQIFRQIFGQPNRADFFSHKSKEKYVRGVLLVLVLLVAVGPTAVLAAALTYSSDTTVSLTSPGVNFTILSSSGADSITVSTTSVVVSVPSSTAFTITSASRDLSYTGQTAGAVITLTCVGGLSTIAVSSQNTATQDLTITPTDSQCNVQPAGTITISGGGYTYQPTPVATSTPKATVATPTITSLQTQLKVLLAQLLELQAQARARGIVTATSPLSPGQIPIEAIPSAGTYRTPLSRKMSGPDVRALQTLLKAQGADIYPEGLITGYFGSLTERAVQRLQLKYGVVNASSDPGFGYVGPKTRSIINSIIQGR